MARLTISVAADNLLLMKPFRIAGHVFDAFQVVVVTLADGRHQGRGEASGVYYLGDDTAHMLALLDAAGSDIAAGPTRDELRTILPPGGARNAVDCALWELEARRAGKPVWQLAGMAAPRRLRTTFTLGADDPAVMAGMARQHVQARAIKIKLTGDLHLDLTRVAAIRAARPDVWLGVDGNQGFVAGDLENLIAGLAAQDVKLLEQPLARGQEAALEGLDSPIPLAGDESIQSLGDVAAAVGRYDVVNIKLDKCGGLTEGLMMAHEARRLGLGVMVGNMGGSSLAMGPGFVLGQDCDIVDLDGPIFLANDRQPGVDYLDGDIWCGPDVWGGAAKAAA